MASEIFQSTKSQEIKGHTFDQIQDTIVPHTALPFKEGHIQAFSQVVVEDDCDTKEGASVLRKISSKHGRSYEFVTGKENVVTFTDEYGNIYTSITAKGNNLTQPHIRMSEITPSGIEFYGLQDSDSMVRALRASEVLRSHGIPTEHFIKVIEPQELPYKGENLALPEFKKRLVRDVWDENAPPDNNQRRFSREDIPVLTKALKDMTFFITVRGMQTPERLTDLEGVRTLEDMDKIMKRAFRYMALDQQKRKVEDPNFKPYLNREWSAKNDFQNDGYFTLILPILLAENISEMHKIGLIHRYPHIGNFSTVGSIYDLDSVMGEPLGLGDEPITTEDIIHDVSEFMYGHGDYSAPSQLARFFRIEDGEWVFRATFLQTYVEKMGWSGDINHIEDVLKVWKDFDNYQRPGLTDHYLKEILQKQKDKYEYSITPDEFAEFVAATLPIHPSSDVNLTDYDTAGLKGQIIAATSLYITLMEIELKKYCKGKKFYKSATDEQKAILLRWFHLSTYHQINQAMESIVGENEDITEEELAIRRENYKQKEKSDEVKIFKQMFLKELIEGWGWEDNIGQHIVEIDKLLDFSYQSDVNYYSGLMRDQLGIEYTHSESAGEIKDLFHAYDTEHIKQLINKAIEADEIGEDHQEIAKRVINTTDDENEWNPKSSSRFYSFLYDRIADNVWDRFDDQFQELEAQYGEDVSLSIVYLLNMKEANRIIDDEMLQEEYEEMQKVADRRTQELMDSYVFQAA